MTEDDSELLRRYAEERSEEAFAALVRRHIDLVYSVALRQVGGDAHLAQDVAQTVFTSLARKAASLAGRPVLGGWLYRTAQFTGIDVVRSESRRRARELEASTMHDFALDPNSGGTVDWEKLRPTLDQAIGELSDDERDAVVLRYLEGKSFAEVGAKLQLNENSARMRVDRALDKLHALLARRGVTSTTAALSLALANQTSIAAPAGMAATVTGMVLAGGGAATAGAGAWTLFMGITKLQIGIAAAIAVAGATGYVVQAETNAGLQRQIAALQEQRPAVAALRAENQQRASAAAEVEMLRRDDVELRQLEQRVVDIKAANVEKMRRANASALNRRKELEDEIREKDRLTQVEVDRMNREGNKLVEEYKALSSRAKDGTITAEERAQAEAGSKAKLDEIRAKQREVQDFITNTRRVLSDRTAEMRRLFPDGGESTIVPLASAGRLELRRTLSNGVDDPPLKQSSSITSGGTVELWSPASNGGESGGVARVSTENDRVSVRLPQVNYDTVISTYENLAGVTIVRDPSISAIRTMIDFQAPPTSRGEAAQALRIALRDQLGIVLETEADGKLVARRGLPR